MSGAQVSVRTTTALIRRVEALVGNEAVATAFPGLASEAPKRSAVLRVALELGVRELERVAGDAPDADRNR